MTPEVYRLASRLFEEALATSPNDPAGWLERLADVNPEAREESLRLVLLHKELESSPFLDEGAEQNRAVWAGGKPLTGKTLANRYQVEELLGEGGMGQVYAAFDQELSQRVAVKTLHLHLSNDPVYRERFRREVLHLREIQHPNVIRIYDFGRDGELFFYTMELLDGQTLAGHIARNGPFPDPELARIANAVLDGLEAVHGLGIVHRDIKPSNVFLSNEGRIILMDFGIAIAIGQATLTKADAVLGSLDYMSPEQINGEPVDHRSDYYSFAVLLYELHEGRQPWDGTSPISRAARRLSHAEPVRALSGELGRTTAACFRRDPSRRPQSIGEIRRLLGGERPVPWKQLLMAAAAVVLAVMLWKAWPKPQVENPKIAQHLKLAAQFSARRTADDLNNARQEFEAAIQLDPGNAEAWTGLAEVYSTISNFGFGDARSNLAKAASAAERAAAIAPNSGAAHAVHAYVVSLDLAKWRTADPLFQRAVQLDPNQARTRLWYGAFLGKIGRFDDALSQLNAGLAIDPGSMTLNQQLVATYTSRRHFAAAVKASEALVRLHPREPSAHLSLCNSLLFAGKLEQARVACEESVRLENGPAPSAVLASVLAAEGKVREARAIADGLGGRIRNVSIQADLYGRLGDTEKAIQVVEQAFAAGDSTIQLIGYSPRFDRLRGLARFDRIRSSLGFDEKSLL